MSETPTDRAIRAAMDAVTSANALVLEGVRESVRREWPDAKTWTRVYWAYDDMEGGDWYLLKVDGREIGLEHPAKEWIDNELCQLLLVGDEYAEYNGEEREAEL